jgi:hypothetical protein
MLRMAARKARLKTSENYGRIADLHTMAIAGCLARLGFGTIECGEPRSRSVASWQLPSLHHVIDTLLNILFRCPHKRITRPITPASKAGVRQGDTYVVCLECGKQFTYDLNEMRVGKPVALSPTEGVLPMDMPKLHTKKVRRYAALASAVPIAWIVTRALKGSRKPGKSNEPPTDGS